MSEYSPAETTMILCMTRSFDCTPEKCLKPHSCWMRDDVRENLIKRQAKWIREQDEVSYDK